MPGAKLGRYISNLRRDATGKAFFCRRRDVLYSAEVARAKYVTTTYACFWRQLNGPVRS